MHVDLSLAARLWLVTAWRVNPRVIRLLLEIVLFPVLILRTAQHPAGAGTIAAFVLSRRGKS